MCEREGVRGAEFRYLRSGCEPNPPCLLSFPSLFPFPLLPHFSQAANVYCADVRYAVFMTFEPEGCKYTDGEPLLICRGLLGGERGGGSVEEEGEDGRGGGGGGGR